MTGACFFPFAAALFCAVLWVVLFEVGYIRWKAHLVRSHYKDSNVEAERFLPFPLSFHGYTFTCRQDVLNRYCFPMSSPENLPKKMTWQCDGASLLSQFCSSSDMTQLWAEPPPDPVQARETLAEHREFTRPKWAIWLAKIGISTSKNMQKQKEIAGTNEYWTWVCPKQRIQPAKVVVQKHVMRISWDVTNKIVFGSAQKWGIPQIRYWNQWILGYTTPHDLLLWDFCFHGFPLF